MRCPKCNKEIDEGQDECPFCGIIVSKYYQKLETATVKQPVDPSPSEEQPPPSRGAAADIFLNIAAIPVLVLRNPWLRYALLIIVIVFAGKAIIQSSKAGKAPAGKQTAEKTKARTVSADRDEEHDCYRFYIDMLTMSKILNTYLDKHRFGGIGPSLQDDDMKVRGLKLLFDDVAGKVSWGNCARGSEDFDQINAAWDKIIEARYALDRLVFIVEDPDAAIRNLPDKMDMTRKFRISVARQEAFNAFDNIWSESQEMLDECREIFL
jgi:hypothetical protein